VDLRVELFDKRRHQRHGFASGEPALDDYLAHHAPQDVRRDIAALFCLVDEARPDVLGFYTLSAGSLPLTDIPEELRRGLPRYDHLPAVLLGRLAIRQDRQGEGLGEMLLFDALERAVAGPIAVWCVVVDALNQRVAAWYMRYGLRPLHGQPLRLIIAAATVRRLLSSPR